MPDVEDPVCGMTFPEESAEDLGASSVTHGAKRYWFCCPHCEQEFRRDPTKYGA